MNLSAQEWESIKTKLNNLKNLADQPGTAGEAAAAAAALQRLLFKYNLSMDDIQVVDKSDYENARYTIGALLSTRESRWKYQLLRAVANNNFCTVLHYTTGRKFVQIIGERHNIVATTVLYEYLEAELNRLFRRDIKKARQDGALRPADGTNAAFREAFEWGYSYRSMAVMVIKSRLAEQRRQDVAEANQTTTPTASAGSAGSALVVQKDREMMDALKKFYPELYGKNAKKHSSRGGYRDEPYKFEGAMAGRNAGREVNLNKQVAGKAETKGVLQ